MSMGAARCIHELTGQHVVITRADGRPIWSDLFEGIEYIRRAHGANIVQMVNAPGARPYIESKTETKWTWKPYKPIPAQMVFTTSELDFAERHRGKTFIEPNIKDGASPNKQWPRGKWIELSSMLPKRTIQCGPEGTAVLPGIEFVRTKTFRLAAAVLSVCQRYIGHEGACHHAAAALGVPAIVIRGEFIGPAVTGYNGQIDFFSGNGLGCGARAPCKGCAKAMDSITVDAVLEAYERVL